MKKDGSFWAWGSKDNPGTKEDVIEVQSTSWCTFALSKDRTLWGWGNMLGCLGLGHDEPVTEPTKLMEDVKMLSAVIGHTLVVLDDDTLWGWGTNKYSEVGVSYGKVHKVPVIAGKPISKK